jgi:hypothetical protein
MLMLNTDEGVPSAGNIMSHLRRHRLQQLRAVHTIAQHGQHSCSQPLFMSFPEPSVPLLLPESHGLSITGTAI